MAKDQTMDRSLRAFVWDGVFSQALGTLTTGVFLTGYALTLGASNGFLGILGALPYLAQFAHIPAIILIERFRRRKLLCIALTLADRILLMPLLALPFLSDLSLAQTLLLVCFAVALPLSAIGGFAAVSWSADLVPAKRLGEIFSRRQMWANASAIAAYAIGLATLYLWSDWYPKWPAGSYIIVFALAIATAFASTWCLLQIRDVPMHTKPQRESWYVPFAKPFRDANFRRMMLFIGSWNFVSTMTLPFFYVYVVRGLGYSVETAVELEIVRQIAGIVVTRYWGHVSDIYGNKTVLVITIPMLLGCTLLWSFCGTLLPQAFTLPFLFTNQVVMGIAMAGNTLANGNIGIKLSPRTETTGYMGVFGLIKALTSGIAAFTSGFLAEFVESTWGVEPWYFLFIGVPVLGALLLWPLRSIVEPDNISARMLLTDLKNQLSKALRWVTSLVVKK